MKATAHIITGSMRTAARSIGRTEAYAMCMQDGPHASAVSVDRMSATARIVRRPGANVYLHVTPVEPQQLLWLVPQIGIDYHVTTSSQLEWKII